MSHEMTRELTLIGPLATPELLDVFGLHGKPETFAGALRGGADAGIGGDWPELTGTTGRVAAARVQAVPDLLRYLKIVGLQPARVEGREVWGLGTGRGADWDASRAGLMAETALALLSRRTLRPDDQAAARLHRIAEIAAGRQRLVTEPDPTAHLPAPDQKRAEIISRQEVYGRYFALDEITLRHRLFSGGWSEPLEREAFISADAALLLPYDPRRDTVLLVSQFRVGPLARGQAQCWMLEPVAGRIDAGESPADAARREAVEEAGLEVGRLYPLPPHYPTPGANSEFFYPFIAACDLNGRASGQGFGLETEGEDIATHILPRAELLSLAESGQLQCGPLITMALMLDRMAARIRADLAGT